MARAKPTASASHTTVTAAHVAAHDGASPVSYKINDSLYLVIAPVCAGATTTAAPPPTHHVLMVDASGSMYGDLDVIKRQLKGKLATMVGPDDVVTLAWFSGPRECAILFEAERVASIADLPRLHKAIDKLTTVGCTCFVDPVRMMADVVKRVRTSHPQHAASGLFLSDGQHNAGGSTTGVIRACDDAAGGFASFACVGYGWYAGMDLLAKMAERVGGSAIQARDFAAWEPICRDVLGRRPTGGARKSVAVGDAVGGFVWAASGGDLLTYTVDKGHASVAADLHDVAWLSASAVGTVAPADVQGIAVACVSKARVPPLSFGAHSHAYAAVALMGQRIAAKPVKGILRALGDVALATRYSTAFGKAATAAFYDTAKAAAFGSGRYAGGYDAACVPRPDAFTVLDVLAVLSADDGCRFFPDHPAFVYTPIGRGRIDAHDAITDDDLASIDAGSSASVDAQLAAIKAAKGVPLKFIADPAPDGYAISGLVPNSEQPNVSLRIRKTGYVDLRERFEAIDKSVTLAMKRGDGTTADAGVAILADTNEVPHHFETFVYRSFAIIADGIVNVAALPVRLTQAVHDVFAREGLVTGPWRGDIVVLDLARLPVLNEQMVATVSAKETLAAAYRLEEVGAAQKVVRHYLKAWFPPASSKGMAEQYGDAASVWLKDQGLTDGSGFAPKSVQAPAVDVRVKREMTCSFKGMSSSPKVDDVRAIMCGAKGKQSAVGALMEPMLRDVANMCATFGVGPVDGVGAWITAHAKDRNVTGGDALNTWLTAMNDALDVERRALLMRLGKAAFTVIVGPAWFTEWNEDMGDLTAKDVEKRIVARKSMTLDNGAEGTITLREVEERV